MARVKYKIGDKVNFTFLGVPEVGLIENIEKKTVDYYKSFSKYNEVYTVNDGKYKYPVAYENIKDRVK